MLELEQIQGNIVPGFYKDAQDFLFVRFPDPASGRKWLSDLAPRLSTAAQILPVNENTRERRKHDDKTPDPSRWVNVALSYAGLEALEIRDIERFPFEFKSNAVQRAERLGDMPLAENFDVGGPQTEAHALLLLGANTSAELNELQDELGVSMARRKVGEVDLIAWHRGESRGDHREHFGFLDGKSQPVPPTFGPDGWQSSRDGQIVAPGEFILGQPNENASTHFSEPEWARNGSYLVFRRFRQDVERFNRALEGHASQLPGGARDPDAVAAKLMGRSRDQQNNPTAQEFAADPLGDRCPLFAHVRKANPRDRVADEPNRHRIIRRGIPYGPDQDREVGLLFVAYQASISRGFEHIATQWLGAPTFVDPAPGLPAEPVRLSVLATPGVDPITAWGNGATHRVFAHKPDAGIANADFVPVDLEQFVEVKGCGYFFAPSLKGITDMVANAAQEEHELSDRQLAELIVEQMPYGKDDVKTGSLHANALTPLVEEGQAPRLPDPHDLSVQVFGALRQYNAANPLKVKVIPAAEAPYVDMPAPNGVVVPADRNVYANPEYGNQIFHVMLPDGTEYRITKGLRIPYRYKDVNGTDVYASIIVLYNGSGEP